MVVSCVPRKRNLSTVAGVNQNVPYQSINQSICQSLSYVPHERNLSTVAGVNQNVPAVRQSLCRSISCVPCELNLSIVTGVNQKVRCQPINHSCQSTA